MRFPIHMCPERELVAVVIGIIKKATFFDDQPPGVRAGTPGVPAQGALAG